MKLFLEPGDKVEWTGKDFIYYPRDGIRAYPVRDIGGEHPYINLPDPKEEDFWEGGELKGDIEREGG